MSNGLASLDGLYSTAFCSRKAQLQASPVGVPEGYFLHEPRREPGLDHEAEEEEPGERRQPLVRVDLFREFNVGAGGGSRTPTLFWSARF